MQVVADVVVSSLTTGVGQRSGKEYYRFEGVIVGCSELPLLSGISFNKFISKEVFDELSTLTQDRFDCSVGISRASVNTRDCDLGFNLFINGFPKLDEEIVEKGNVLPSPASESDKNKK